MKKVLIFKKILALLIAIGVLLTTNTSVFASEQENYGVTENPIYLQDNSGITVQGRDIPSSTWNIEDDGEYTFSGSANTVKIYTSYQFLGKTSYTVTIHNSGSGKLKVTAKSRFHTYGSTEISSGEDGAITFSTDNDTDKFYVLFTGSTFYGSVK
jgi:uncharacterized protein YxeA